MDETTVLSEVNVGDFIENPPEDHICQKILASPKASLDSLRDVAKSKLRADLRAGVLRNPNITEDIVELFAMQSSSKKRHTIGGWVGWVDTWIIEAFERVNSWNTYELAISSPFQVDANALLSYSQMSSFLLKYAQQIAIDLWVDLASRGILDLIYEMPEGYVHRLGPFHTEGFEELAWEMPARSVFCKYVERDSWLDLEPIFNVETFEEAVLILGQQYFDETDIGVANSYEFKLYSLVKGKREGHFKFLGSEQAEYEDIYDKGFEILGGSDFFISLDEWLADGDYHATVVSDPPMVKSPRYRDLAPYAQREFAALLTRAQRHYMVKAFSVSEHIGKLMLMHPETHSSAKDILLSSEIPNLASV